MPKERIFVSHSQVKHARTDLRRPLGRTDGACLEDDEAIAYVLGWLGAQDRSNINEHIDACPACADGIAWLSGNMLDPGKGPRLKPGDRLQGQERGYEIVEFTARGAYGETYRARVVDGGHGGLGRRRDIVIKIATPSDGEDLPRAPRRLRELLTTHAADVKAWHRLTGLPCATPPLDWGTHAAGRLPAVYDDAEASPFIVTEWTTGKRLDLYMAWKFGADGRFTGIARAEFFFEWARKLALALRDIHRRSVVHRDIRPENIVVGPDDAPVFIDFGQALFRHIARPNAETLPYVPPDGTEFIGSDIYALGGVLFYLATGAAPPAPEEDIEELKEAIAAAVSSSNRTLYDENQGVVDVITRCLRYDGQGRAATADRILEDIDTIVFRPPNVHRQLAALQDRMIELVTAGTPRVLRMAALQIGALERTLEGMRHGAYDVEGDHEILVNTLCRYLSDAGKSTYLSPSVPGFYHQRNAGINGRFLTMNKLAALGGATIRRVLVITHEEQRIDPELPRIIRAHRYVMQELRELQERTHPGRLLQTDDPTIDGGYYTGFVMMSDKERRDLIRANKHFGVIIDESDEFELMLPVYREDGQLVALQFRSGTDARELREDFARVLSRARPISEYPL
jgi:serine/threonine protein kinase